MNVDRDQRVTVELTDLSYLGDGVAHIDGNFVLFVEGGLPGERVVAEIVDRRTRYGRAQVVDVLTASPDRVRPPCPFFGRCGGCQIQHLDYDAQLSWKSEMVRSQLQRVGHLGSSIVHPMIGSGWPWNYRNHARFSIDSRGRLGYSEAKSHQHLAVDLCKIMQEPIVAAMPRLQGARLDSPHIVVRYGARTGQLLIAPPLLPAPSDLETGQASYDEVLFGRTLRVSAPSFFQVNTRFDVREFPPKVGERWRQTFLDGFSMAELLVALVLDRLALTGRELVLDAYCGVGAFTLPIAEEAGDVVGIDEAPIAVSDAEFNGRDVPNARFVAGRAEDTLATFERRPDAVVLDPSRLGCAPAVLDELGRLSPATIVYVSCDTATLARDLGRLISTGYELVDVQPVDMFPQTRHVETVSHLRRRSS